MKLRLGWRAHRKTCLHQNPPNDTAQTTLDNLMPGQPAQVVELCGGRGMVSRMVSLGFTPGAAIHMVQNFGHGPLIVSVRETRVALGRGEAKTVIVRQGRV